MEENNEPEKLACAKIESMEYVEDSGDDIKKAQKNVMRLRIILTFTTVLGAIFVIMAFSGIGGNLANHRVDQWAGVGVILITFFVTAIAISVLPSSIISIIISAKQKQNVLTTFLTTMNVITIASIVLIMSGFYISWYTGNWLAWFVNF